MHKPVKLVLILSIVVNAIWLIGAASGWLSFGKSPDAAAQAKTNVSGAGGLSPKAAKEVKALLSTNDAAALRDKLRSLGLPEDVVREVVAARVQSPYEARKREILAEQEKAKAQRPYWRGKFSWSWDEGLTNEQYNEMSKIWRDERKQVTQVLGRDGEIPSQAQIMYAFLSPDRAEQFADMKSDYGDMRREVEQGMSNFRMPGDNAQLKLLDDEYKRDADAFLTPDEKMENDLRSSSTARNLQYAFTDFDGTEDEYKTIFALQHALDEKYPTDSMMANEGGGMADFLKEREAAQKEVDAQIKDALGDERYADYLRAQRQDYKSLQAAARRFNLDEDTVAETYQVRDDTASAAKQISDDTSLSAEQKNEAYAALAEQATGQIHAALGDDVGDAYINNALVWLKNLPKGGTVKIDEKGNVSVSQPKPEKP